MDEKELLTLVENGESQTVEFKESLSLKDDIGEAVSAFSNCNDGLILVGVGDKREIVGVQTGKRTLEDLANYLKTHTDNHVFPKISVEGAGAKKIVLIAVSESKEKPVFFKGRAYGKVGKSVHKLSASEIRKLAKESGEKVYWDGQICEEAKLEDIDEEKVKWFLRKAKYERNFGVDPETPFEEALERLELVKGGKPTNAAVLLFGKNPQGFFLQAELRCGRFKGVKPVKPFIDMKVFGGTVFDQVDKSLNFVLEHTPMKVYLAGRPEREEKYDYPPDAVREAIINAVCHRDYGLQSNVQVRIFDDRIEVWGCGGLPEPLKPEDLVKKHDSLLRNPLIAKCFFLIKFIERWGTGTNDMVNACLDWGLPEPLFEEVAGSFVVTFTTSLFTEDYLDALGLNGRQKKAVEYAKEHGRIDRKAYCRVSGVGKTLAHKELSDLVEKELMERVGKGRGVYYALRTERTISGRLADDLYKSAKRGKIRKKDVSE